VIFLFFSSSSICFLLFNLNVGDFLFIYSNWGDHCQRVTKAFGVVSQRTPHGLQWEEFENALSKYAQQQQQQQQQQL